VLFGFRQSDSKAKAVCAVWFDLSLLKVLKYQNDKQNTYMDLNLSVTVLKLKSKINC
jgi:hypothetical protein